MADTLYFVDDYVASGYTVYTASAIALQGSSATLTASANVYSQADLLEYVHPDYWANDYVKDKTYGSATVDAVASISATLDLATVGDADLTATSTASATPERQRPGTADISVQGTISIQADKLKYSNAALSIASSVDAIGSAKFANPGLGFNNTASFSGAAVRTVGGSADISGVYYPYFDGGVIRSPDATEIPWDYDSGTMTWQTYFGQTWAYNNAFVLEGTATLSVVAGKEPGLGVESLDAEAVLSSTGVVGHTEYSSITVDNTATVSTDAERTRSITKQLDTTSTLTCEAVRKVGGSIDLQAQALITKANAIFEISASATLEAQSILRFVADGEATFNAEATWSAQAERTVGGIATLDAFASKLVYGIVGQTEYASATLLSESDFESSAVRNAGGFATLPFLATTLAYGRVLGFDPDREYSIEQETRYVRVMPETQIYTVKSENSVNTVIGETGGLIVPQETRNTRTIQTTYQKRRELA